MKKILLSFLLLVSSLSAIEWMEYEKALTQAKKENKIVMVMLGRDSCGVCSYMKTVVFHNKNVIKKLDSKFIGVYIELDFDDLPEGMNFIGTPTFYFVDNNGKTLLRFDGGKTVPSFIKALNEIN
ncbi:MAG: thioredoxin-related protein [Sulfurimonas sp.]|jgi:thioredoxin-related protein|uniref:thioredoxin family protein n=1 Tax=Sulfurimonas sp. TaxID=2022749 RepID=UPI0039E2DE4A